MRQVLLLMTFVIAVVGAAACREHQEMAYADAAEARKDGAIKRGWIPEWLPASARNIRELHDLDTNRSMLTFSFDPADVPGLPPCKQIEPEHLRPAPFSVVWWPSDIPPTKVRTVRHVYYLCEDRSFIAMSIKDGELFHWRP